MSGKERFITSGEVWFGTGPIRLTTLLGSCVAVVLWHPRRGVGGLCHFMLPQRGLGHPGSDTLDGRYGDEAVELLVAELRAIGTLPAEYHTRLYGGGRMFPGYGEGLPDIGKHNVTMARLLLARHGFRLVEEHVGGPHYRHLALDLPDGAVVLRVENATTGWRGAA